VIDEGLFTRQLVDAYLFFFFTSRIFCSPVIHRGLSGGELVLKDSTYVVVANVFYLGRVMLHIISRGKAI